MHQVGSSLNNRQQKLYYRVSSAKDLLFQWSFFYHCGQGETCESNYRLITLEIYYQTLEISYGNIHKNRSKIT